MSAVFTPHPYQAYCIQRIINDPAVALWLDMGLGKTVSALTAVNVLKYDRFAIRKALVIAPKKVAEATWSDEAKKWQHLSLLRVSVVLGSAAKRIRALCTPADVYVINRVNVAWLVDYYGHKWPFDMVIIDEASSFKNQQSKRWKQLRSIRPHISRIVELTGTPAPQSLCDLWPQIYLLDMGQRLGKTIGGFRERYMLPDKRNAQQVFTYKPKDGAEQTVKSLLSDICISMSAKDYLTLPDIVYDDVPVLLDPAAEKQYRQLEREALLEVPDGEITACNAAVLTGKLLQLACGAVYNNDGGSTVIHDCKIEAFVELIEQLEGQHALVFYSFRQDIPRLTEALKKTKLRVRAYQGADDAAAWNAGEADVLLAHPASCAYGLNLQAGGHHIVWFGLSWSLEQYQQANARLHRQGQAEPVIVHHLIVKGTMDEDVLDVLSRKSDTQERLLASLRKRIAEYRQEAEISDS
jgi:SNF2 family DNA or RNA helicase